MKVRPGSTGRRLGTPRVVASSLPRTIINSSPRRRKVVKPGATSPHAVVQQVTNNLTGKKAVGPWLGPFAASAETQAKPTDDLMPSTIYMDSQGGCHLDLDPSDDKRMAQQLFKAQSDSGLLSEAANEMAAKLASQQLELRREKQQQTRAVQQHSLFAHAALDKVPVRNDVRRMRMINQPRRFN